MKDGQVVEKFCMRCRKMKKHHYEYDPIIKQVELRCNRCKRVYTGR